MLRTWLRERQGQPREPLFPTRRGGPLTPKAVAWLLDKHIASATRTLPVACRQARHPARAPSHQRDAAARRERRHLTIALWLGHESTKSTEIYLHADNKLKQQAIERTAPTGTPPGRYKPPDKLLAFLERL